MIVTVAEDGVENVLYPDENAPKFYRGGASDGAYTRYEGLYIPSDATVAPFILTVSIIF